MSIRLTRAPRSGSICLLVTLAAVSALAQSAMQPVNDPPNPYQTVVDYLKLPEGRVWGSTAAVEIDKDGRSVWVAERCGASTYPNGCFSPTTGQMSTLDSILKFDPSGKLVKSFGSGMLTFPHGIYVDRDGNVWVTDGGDNAPQPQRGRDGKVIAFIPDPNEKATGTSAAEGVAADAAGNIYGAEVGPHDVKRYVKK